MCCVAVVRLATSGCGTSRDAATLTAAPTDAFAERAMDVGDEVAQQAAAAEFARRGDVALKNGNEAT